MTKTIDQQQQKVKADIYSMVRLENVKEQLSMTGTLLTKARSMPLRQAIKKTNSHPLLVSIDKRLARIQDELRSIHDCIDNRVFEL